MRNPLPFRRRSIAKRPGSTRQRPNRSAWRASCLSMERAGHPQGDRSLETPARRAGSPLLTRPFDGLARDHGASISSEFLHVTHQKERKVIKFNKGDKVRWNWGNGTGAGEVSESFAEKVSRTIRGTEVTRDADDQNPAYLIEQEDGGRVLKSESELTKTG
ncbi:MAG TPA: DUF2945 domain-containing protein [Aurantimonas sp.]